MRDQPRWIALLLMAASCALVQAQSPASTPTLPALKPTPSSSTSTTTTATKKPNNSGVIYRWVDSQGRVQYGADVPEQYQAKARKVDSRGNIVRSRVPASIGVPAAQPAEPTQPVARKPLTEREKCEAAWQEYRASQACFDPFRRGSATGGRSIAPEALGQCKDVAEPAPCR